MQTLAQRYSRAYHARHGGRGHLWRERYHACLLADDSALIAAWAWLHRCGRHHGQLSRPFTPLPLRQLPDGSAVAADEAPFGLPPPPAHVGTELAQHLADNLTGDDLAMYGQALNRSWCLGRPESLVEAQARLGRDVGRGRSRRRHELNDQLGLCGVWG
jgi:hypothetical protein